MRIKVDSGVLLNRIRKESPVVHHLTNWVTVNDCAQAVKSLGASPIIAHDPGEVEEVVSIASSLVLNIGTLTKGFVRAMLIAAKVANKNGIPVVLDVCGVGATKLRGISCRKLTSLSRIDIIKGNASEIAFLSGERVRPKGVDSVNKGKGIQGQAIRLARENKCVVVATGEVDIITDGKDLFRVLNGDKIMPLVVGTGCIAASVIGAFVAVEEDLVKASIAALSCLGVSAEIAAKKSKGPGSFKGKLFDQLSLINPKVLNKKQRIS